MSISALFVTEIPSSALKSSPESPQMLRSTEGRRAGIIQCSSRPRKKATSHHMKTRPRKSQLWDIKRGRTVYPPLPPLPTDWTLVSDLSSPEVPAECPTVPSSS